MGRRSTVPGRPKRATIPPYPHFYELLYTYATGVNPALNARINAIMATGEPSVEMAERLYNEFLKSQDANERLTGVSERMSHRIEAMHDAIDTGGDIFNLIVLREIGRDEFFIHAEVSWLTDVAETQRIGAFQ